MTRIARILSDQQVTLDDFSHLAEDPRDLVDLLARTAIETGRAYYGGTVTKTGTTRISVSTPLGLYSDGQIYSRPATETIEFDLLAQLPTTGNQRIVAVVVTGSTQQDDTEERDFAVGVVNDVIQTEARPTATRIYRRADVAIVAGLAAPQPARPILDSAVTVIAYVTLSSTEVISSSIEQSTDARIVPLSTAVERVADVEAFKAKAEPVLDGLKSDIARLSQGLGTSPLLTYLLESVARINERVGIGTDSVFSSTDYFLDTTGSDAGFLGYVAKVEEGLRFDNDAVDTASLVLANPGDSSFIVHADGLLLPKYEAKTLISNWRRDTEVALSNSGSQTTAIRKKTISRTRMRVGKVFLVSSGSVFWQTGRFQPSKLIFERAGETFNVVESFWAKDGKHKLFRLQQFWVDRHDDVYWDALTTTASYTGNVAAQTFLMPRAAWVVGVNIGFSRIDSSGDVRVVLMEVSEVGAPDPNRSLADVIVPHASLKIFPARTPVQLPPVFCEAGRRYAVFIKTAANHWVAISEGNKFAQGSYFVSTDGAWFQGDISRDIAMEISVAEFEAPRLVVALDDWNLSGGVTDLDLSLEQVAPAPMTVNFEIKSGSGSWTPVAETTAESGIFAGLPASLDARMTLQGTTELMPGIRVSSSKVTKRRPRTSFTHVSAIRTTPVAIDEVHVVATLEGYDETPHDCAVTLLVGAGYATVVSPSAVSSETLPDGTVRRTWKFVGLAPTTTFRRKVTGSTTSALSTFVVSSITDVAFPA